MSFFRRADISVMERALIGLRAIAGNGVYGVVTDIARRYGVSRTFVYELRHLIFNGLKADSPDAGANSTSDHELADNLILLMRLCCKSSIAGISEALKIIGLPHSSVGYISEFLNRKSALAVDELPVPDAPVTVLADEIFASGNPILVILEARSHAILAVELAENRSGESWRSCFESLTRKGYIVKKVAKDFGSGMTKGMSELGAVAQADLFHLLKNFDPYLGSLERAALSAIEGEDNALNVLWNRRSDGAIQKQFEKCVRLSGEAERKIRLYDDYDYLHKELHAAFNPFEKDGDFRDEERLWGDVSAILDLLSEVFGKNDGIMKAAAFLRKHFEEYLPYARELSELLREAGSILPEYLIREVCLNYQKGLKSVAVKDYGKSKKLEIEAESHLNTALLAAGDSGMAEKVSELREKLSCCVRSSSALEAKNSVIRQYLDSTSSQVTIQHLRLIAFHLNRKVSTRGKYKGFSPIERLSGVKYDSSILDALAG